MQSLDWNLRRPTQCKNILKNLYQDQISSYMSDRPPINMEYLLDVVFLLSAGSHHLYADG